MKDNEDYFIKIIPGIFEKYGRNTDGIYITSGLKIDSPGVYRLCFPQNGQKKQATEKRRPFRGKICTAAQVALLQLQSA